MHMMLVSDTKPYFISLTLNGSIGGYVLQDPENLVNDAVKKILADVGKKVG